MGFVKESQILVKLSSEKAEEFLKNKYPIGYSIYKRTEGVPPQAFIGMFNSFTESEMAKVNESMSFEQLKAIKKGSKSKNKASKIKKIKRLVSDSDARYEDIDSITDKFMDKGFSIEDVEYLIKDVSNHSLEEKADMLHYFIQKNSDRPYDDFETLDEAVGYVSTKLNIDAEEFYKSIQDKALETSDIMYNSEKFTVVHSKSTEAAQYWEQSAVTWNGNKPTSGLCTARVKDSLFKNYSEEYYVIQIISKPFPTENINPMVSFSENLKKNNLISMCIDKKTGEIIEGKGATVNRFNEDLTSLQIYVLLGEEYSDIINSIYSDLILNSGMSKEIADKNQDRYSEDGIDDTAVFSALNNKSVMETDIAKRRVGLAIERIDSSKSNYSSISKNPSNLQNMLNILKNSYSDLKDFLDYDKCKMLIESVSEKIKVFAGEEGLFVPPPVKRKVRNNNNEFFMDRIKNPTYERTVFGLIMDQKYREYCDSFIFMLIKNFRSKIQEKETFDKFAAFLTNIISRKNYNDRVWENSLYRNNDKINSLAKAIARSVGARDNDVDNIDISSSAGLINFISIRDESGRLVVDYSKNKVYNEIDLIDCVTMGMTHMEDSELAKAIVQISDSASNNSDLFRDLARKAMTPSVLIEKLSIRIDSNEYQIIKLINEIILVLASLKISESKEIDFSNHYSVIYIAERLNYAYKIAESFKTDFNPIQPLHGSSKRHSAYTLLSGLRSSEFRDIADRCVNGLEEIKNSMKNIFYNHFRVVEADNDKVISAIDNWAGKGIMPTISELEKIRISVLRDKREISKDEFASKVDEIPDLCKLFDQAKTIVDNIDDGGTYTKIYTSYMIPSLSDCEYFIKHRLHECEGSEKETARRLDNTDVYRSDSKDNIDLGLYIMDLEEQCPEGYSPVEAISDEDDFGAFYPSKDMDDVIEHGEDYGNYENDDSSEDDDDSWGSSEEERDLFSDIDRRARYSFLYKMVKGF